jgi:hypothetical protein
MPFREVVTQLFWHAVAGERDAEQANDVRPTFLRLLLGYRQILNCSVLPHRPADTMPHQADDAPTPSRDFLQHPDRHSPTSLRRITPHAGSDTVDLTSPPRSSPGSRTRANHPHATHTRPQLQNRRSADEKRLVGDYKYGANLGTSARRGRRADLGNSVPADRVNVPDPASYFKPPMVKVRLWNSVDRLRAAHDANVCSLHMEKASTL